IAAMETGVFNPNDYVVCNGGYQVGKRFIRCLGHHGAISFNRAMEKSCNTYFMTLAHRVGVDALRKAAAEVGLGQTCGIDAPQERPSFPSSTPVPAATPGSKASSGEAKRARPKNAAKS